MSTDLKTNSDVEKLKNRRKQNFKDESHNAILLTKQLKYLRRAFVSK